MSPGAQPEQKRTLAFAGRILEGGLLPVPHLGNRRADIVSRGVLLRCITAPRLPKARKREAGRLVKRRLAVDL